MGQVVEALGGLICLVYSLFMLVSPFILIAMLAKSNRQARKIAQQLNGTVGVDRKSRS